MIPAPEKPEMGKISRPRVECHPKIILKATPRAAPPEMPKVYGSTKELRNSPCRITPAKLKPPPTAKPKIILGRRRSKRMLYSVVPFPKRAILQIFFRGIAAEPVHKERRLTPNRIVIRKAIRESQEMSLFIHNYTKINVNCKITEFRIQNPESRIKNIKF